MVVPAGGGNINIDIVGAGRLIGGDVHFDGDIIVIDNEDDGLDIILYDLNGDDVDGDLPIDEDGDGGDRIIVGDLDINSDDEANPFDVLYDEDGNPEGGGSMLDEDAYDDNGDNLGRGPFDIIINPDGNGLCIGREIFSPEGDRIGAVCFRNFDGDIINVDIPLPDGFELSDGEENDDGGFRFDIILVLPDEDTSGGGGSIDGTQIIVTGGGPLGGGNPVPDDVFNSLDITTLDINSDNVDPINGGFIVITATGDPGATATVTITPSILVDGFTEVMTINVVIGADGTFVQSVRIPSIVGDQNLGKLGVCSPEDFIPEELEDGLMWTITGDLGYTDDEGNEMIETYDPVMQDDGGQVCINFVSSDPGIIIPTTIIQNTRGFAFDDGVIRHIIPAQDSQNWTLIDPVDGVVRISDDNFGLKQGETVSAGVEICNGTALLNSNGDLVLNQPYTGGQIQQDKVTYEINLDDVATQNTEVVLLFENGEHYTFADHLAPGTAKAEFVYGGTPGDPVVAGDTAVSVALVAAPGFTWHDTDIDISSFPCFSSRSFIVFLKPSILANNSEFTRCRL